MARTPKIDEKAADKEMKARMYEEPAEPEVIEAEAIQEDVEEA